MEIKYRNNTLALDVHYGSKVRPILQLIWQLIITCTFSHFRWSRSIKSWFVSQWGAKTYVAVETLQKATDTWSHWRLSGVSHKPDVHRMGIYSRPDIIIIIIKVKIWRYSRGASHAHMLLLTDGGEKKKKHASPSCLFLTPSSRLLLSGPWSLQPLRTLPHNLFHVATNILWALFSSWPYLISWWVEVQK